MNFLYVGPFRFPDGDAAASRVLNNIRILKYLEHNVDVVSFGGAYRTKDKTASGVYVYDSIPYVITNDIDTHSLKERFRRYILPPQNAWNIIKKKIEGYDAIIIYNPGLALNIQIINLCKKYRKKLILDLTEWYSSDDFPGGKWSPFYWMNEWNMRYTQKRYNNIIPISRYLADYYTNANKIVLPPLINCDDTKWRKSLLVVPEAISFFEGKRIIFAGTPGKKDLLGNLLNATLSVVKEGMAIQVIVVGVDARQGASFFSNDEYKQYRNNFVFMGRQPQEDVPGYYQLADFSAIIREPNRKNSAGFPTKMTESMASGCPVLLNTTSDLSDYVVDMENAIVIKDYSVDSIVDGLRRIVMLDKEQVIRMKKMAMSVAKRRFDYYQYNQLVSSFIETLR